MPNTIYKIDKMKFCCNISERVYKKEEVLRRISIFKYNFARSHHFSNFNRRPKFDLQNFWKRIIYLQRDSRGNFWKSWLARRKPVFP